MFDYLNKKITKSIIIAVISVLTIECAAVFGVYSYLNIRDYTKKSSHLCDQISAYIELRLRSYEESTSFFINNNDFEDLIRSNSPKTLSLFSQFVASNIGIQNVFIYNEKSSIVYQNNSIVSEYIAEQRHNQAALPNWDVYSRDDKDTKWLIYSCPIKSADGTDMATFAISISPELLSDNTINRNENRMTQNTVSFIGADKSGYCSINPDSKYYEKAKKRYEFSRSDQEHHAGSFHVSNTPIANSGLYLQTFVPLGSVLLNILVMGMIILSILIVFSILSYTIIRHYSRYLIGSLTSLSNKIEDFSQKEL